MLYPLSYERKSMKHTVSCMVAVREFRPPAPEHSGDRPPDSL